MIVGRAHRVAMQRLRFERGADPRVVGEVETPDDPDAFGQMRIRVYHFAVAGEVHERLETLVLLRDALAVPAAVRVVGHPEGDERQQVRKRVHRAQPANRDPLDACAEVVKIVGVREVKRLDLPARMAVEALQMPFVREQMQREAQRCARHAGRARELPLRITLAGQHPEFEDVVLDPLVPASASMIALCTWPRLSPCNSSSCASARA
ncbi:hypothetical protein C7408_10719 [Paraburkholderia caballeronis]|nr:hypothetical protein [Paraburkholderia caballeronis]TDV14907.1 hypothetical protein C7408_10719 [Paraburkholderia caballeronis]TDV16969.1 hypothetical protein C7406_107230 [Paraburkholderia caballeronis]TDV25643.1 hypothetical protein C7404_10719 [Paraburkholderia caballeronis]